MTCTLGLYEKAMPGSLTWEEKLSVAKATGFDAIEISIDESDQKLARLEWTAEQRLSLLNMSRQKGIMINTMCLSGHRKYPLGSSDRETEYHGMEIMKKAIQLASDIGIRIIQLAGYDVYYNETGSPETRQRFIDNLIISVEMAAAKGVILAFETMETDFCNTISKAMDFVSIVNSPYCKVYPDVGNITNAASSTIPELSNEFPLEFSEKTDDLVCLDIRSGKGHIAAAHLKETVPGKFRDLRFGDGYVNFKLVTDELKAQGVRMYTAEFWYDGGSDWHDELSRTNKFLRSYLS